MKRIPFSLFLSFAVLMGVSGAAYASVASSQIQMLPPWQDATSTLCAPVGGNKVLTWDGMNTIKCRTGLVVDDSGNVGIGTASPAAKLHVQNSSNYGIIVLGGNAAGNGNVITHESDGSFGIWNTPVGSGSRLLSITSVGMGVAGSVKLANDAAACSAAKEGTQRYNSSVKKMEFCNGTAWAAFATEGSVVGGLYTLGANCNDAACRYPNPVTGTCTCPSGFHATKIWEFKSTDGTYADGNATCIANHTVHYVTIHECTK